MNNLEYFKERFERLKAENRSNGLGTLRQAAFNNFSKMGIPTSKHEEWKYTRISSLFNKEYQLPVDNMTTAFSATDLDPFRLPGHENASELVFVNGVFSFPLSTIRSSGLVILPLAEAARNEYKDIVANNLGHSSTYQIDGLNALNMAFVLGAVFVEVRKGQLPGQPIYVYNITDARSGNILSQPRCLMHICENVKLQLVESYGTIGMEESLTNQVMEIIVEKDANLEYYKIQNDVDHTNLVSTTHISQTGKSYIHTVTVSLNGGIVRNNLNVVLDAEHCEAHLYGLYLQNGHSHIDNHTVVDNVKPNCFSNELYKGMIDGLATGVFNGKIFVRPQAQKTNAYQSNKNILLSEEASMNSKPQLEIFANDVKCSHGCTVGRLNEEGLFYLQSRGISEKMARSLLLHAYTVDILEHIKSKPIRDHIEKLILARLEFPNFKQTGR